MTTHVPAFEPQPGDTEPGVSEPPRILIVDDQEEIRHLIRICLPRNFDVFEASNCGEAIDAMWLKRPNLVILDIVLPGGPDGLSLLEMIRNEPEFKDVRVIVLSARTAQDYHARAERLLANAYVEKPFSPVQLGQLARDLVRTENVPGGE